HPELLKDATRPEQAPTSTPPGPTAAEAGAVESPKKHRSGVPNKVCAPGTFFCAEHGMRAEYFACDAVGLPLPASCGASNVCYQFGISILCDARGGTARTGGMLG
ncbi:hypothetical protein H4R21_003361, partial [Coemansia helicoidea]